MPSSGSTTSFIASVTSSTVTVAVPPPAPDDEGRRATQLGAGPFTYDVALTMDGRTYHGLGTWPDGETEDTAPHVPLTWTPELPAYDG